jgi:hypothetical protein
MGQAEVNVGASQHCKLAPSVLFVHSGQLLRKRMEAFRGDCGE